jgi:hypothetical protein
LQLTAGHEGERDCGRRIEPAPHPLHRPDQEQPCGFRDRPLAHLPHARDVVANQTPEARMLRAQLKEGECYQAQAEVLYIEHGTKYYSRTSFFRPRLSRATRRR